MVGLFAAAVDEAIHTSHTENLDTLIEEAPASGVETWSAQTFPRAFEGTFTWDTDFSKSAAQNVRYTVQAVQERDGVLVATGQGKTSYIHYPCEPTVAFDFRIEVDQSTGAFEMWESNPSIEENYVTEGKYVSDLSMLSGSLDTFYVKWKGDDGQDGRLVLTGMEPAQDVAFNP